jgi:hypothetical protein
MIARIWKALLAASPPRFWAQVGAAQALTLFAAAIVVIIWRGPWTLAVEAARVEALARVCLAVLFLVLVALAAITELKFGLRGGKDGFSADVERDDDEAKARVTTTTTTEITAPATAPTSEKTP